MASVIVEKPYQFVPPHRGNWWPSFIQLFKLYEPHLRKKDGVVGYEIRNSELLKKSLDEGHGIMLAPNHCRYSDPLVLGWLAKHVGTHVFAMASWHLFNMGRMNAFSIQKMGGFSVNREGLDKQSIETAIDALVTAERPLILFAEGATFRSNDNLQPLLDGASFIARTAARRRAKKTNGKVLIHPIAIKYVFEGDFAAWAEEALRRLEQHLTWLPDTTSSLLQRVTRLAEAILAIKEVEYFGTVGTGGVHSRKQVLIGNVISQLEQQWQTSASEQDPTMVRIKALRTATMPGLLDQGTAESQRESIRQDLKRVEFAQQLASFPEGYLAQPPVTETRVLETIENMEEGLLGTTSWPGPLKAVIQVCEPIEVSPEKAPKGQTDPMLDQLSDVLSGRLAELANESRPIAD